jgi:hypothetical protein
MAKNDTVLIDSLLRKMQEDSGKDIGDLFEKMVLEQILKNFDLTDEELEFGWIDGSHDGGIDGFYIFINGRLLTDASDFLWPKTGAEIQVYLVTCKHKSSFQQVPLDALLASLHELLDFTRTTNSLSGKYSAEVKRCRDLLVAAFEQLSLTRPVLSFEIFYACRGETDLMGESIEARANQLTSLITSYFSGATSSFHPLGPKELVELYREIKTFSLNLPVQECLTAGDEGYVVLSKLQDFAAFVQDEHGKLRRYLFDSNVRAYLGTNLVNGDIAETLTSSTGPNFWWLNNGVTILASSASLVGKTLKLKDIQIVNGLQTTESVHRHFSTAPSASENRSLLVKVIVSQDETVRDQVIRATNNQSSVEPSALHATDKIQRNIEEILLRREWYYERRTNFYKNEGRPSGRIISPIALASGSIAILMRNPARSSRLKQRQLRLPEAYSAVYGDHFPLDAWPAVAALIRAAENSVARIFRTKRAAHTPQASSWRGPAAFIAMSRISGTVSFTHQQVAALLPELLTDDFMDECLAHCIEKSDKNNSSSVTQVQMDRVIECAIELWGLKGDPLERRQQLPNEFSILERKNLDESFLRAVSEALPVQPWKPGVHTEVAKQLNVRGNDVSAAIQKLITRGEWQRQKDGVVYDSEGNVIARDPSRAISSEGTVNPAE